MHNKIDIKIQASKIYLTLSVFIYCLGLFATWYYFYTLWLSVILSGLLSLWLLYFLPKSVNLTHPNSIVKMVLDKNRLTIEKNNHSIQQSLVFYPAYQSRFLIIINVGKESVVIFKDALASQSLSQLNRYFNTKTTI